MSVPSTICYGTSIFLHAYPARPTSSGQHWLEKPVSLLPRSCEVSDPSGDRCCAQAPPRCLSTSALPCRLWWLPLRPLLSVPYAGLEPLASSPPLAPSKSLSWLRPAKQWSWNKSNIRSDVKFWSSKKEKSGKTVARDRPFYFYTDWPLRCHLW